MRVEERRRGEEHGGESSMRDRSAAVGRAGSVGLALCVVRQRRAEDSDRHIVLMTRVRIAPNDLERCFASGFAQRSTTRCNAALRVATKGRVGQA